MGKKKERDPFDVIAKSMQEYYAENPSPSDEELIALAGRLLPIYLAQIHPTKPLVLSVQRQSAHVAKSPLHEDAPLRNAKSPHFFRISITEASPRAPKNVRELKCLSNPRF